MHVKTKDYEDHEKDMCIHCTFLFFIQNNFYHQNNLLVLQIITKYYDITCLEINLFAPTDIVPLKNVIKFI